MNRIQAHVWQAPFYLSLKSEIEDIRVLMYNIECHFPLSFTCEDGLIRR